MRIISGSLKSRQFQSPHGHRTHPMSEKVRGALFNMLGDIKDLTVLDAFAGSGALSFEAVSRGAKNVVAVDTDKSAHKTIVNNARELGLTDQIKVIKANIGGWSDNNPTVQFDLVLLDPPHDSLQQNQLEKLTKHVKQNGLLALNWPGRLDIPVIEGLKKVEERSYGDTQLVFYRRIA